MVDEISRDMGEFNYIPHSSHTYRFSTYVIWTFDLDNLITPLTFMHT